MGVLDYFKSFRREEHLGPPEQGEESAVKVGFDVEQIWVREPSGQPIRMTWSELRGVLVETRESGSCPWELIWSLCGTDRIVAFPNGATGMPELCRELENLPGFDQDAFFEAMSSIHQATFVLWDRSRTNGSAD